MDPTAMATIAHLDVCAAEPLPPAREHPLRRALTANALFSGTTGLTMLLTPATVGGWLGIEADPALRLLGAGLILCAADLLLQSHRRQLIHPLARLTIAADIGWVIGSATLVLAAASFLTPTGVGLILVIATIAAIVAIVAGSASPQISGLRAAARAGSPAAPPMHTAA